MRKWLCLLLMLTMLLSACGGSGSQTPDSDDLPTSQDTDPSQDGAPGEEEPPEEENEPAPQPEDGAPSPDQDEPSASQPSGGTAAKPSGGSKPSGGTASQPSGGSKPSGGNTTPSQPGGSGGGSTQPADETPSGTLTEIMEQIYAGVTTQMPMIGNNSVTADNAEYFTGVTADRFEEALASEALITSVAHSVVLVRAKSLEDVETLKSDILSGVNPYKWVCVGVEKENVIVTSRGKLILLVMDNFAPTELRDSFLALGK